MRRKVSLYIAGQPVDLSDQSFILFNYTMEDLSNPTIVRNSFSQQITLMGTPNNNKVFGGIFRLDRQTQYGASYAGAEFDASRKTPFVIYNEMNEIVESGYCKLDEVVKARDVVEYKVTLYGGLGSFFYGMMYKEDGSKMSLADMRYQYAGGYTTIPGHFGQYGGYHMLLDCWSYLQDPEAYDEALQAGDYDCWWAHIINFAPAYNGLPDNFSADKAVCNKPFANVPNYQYISKEDTDGSPVRVEYSFKTGTQSNLMLFTNPHTEWEIRDLRWYLQRPVVRIKAIFDAICDPENNGGYEVKLFPSFFNESNDLYWNGWMTLPLIPAEDRQQTDDVIVKLLSASLSPADYLIGFAKMFGLIFVYDRNMKKVSIMTRSDFYESDLTEVIDLTERVDKRDIKITPVLAQSRYYQYGSDAIGEWAKAYKEDYGRDYAIQRVNTGNEFNSDTEVVTKDIPLKDAVEVQERNLLFTSNAFTRDEQGLYDENFILPMYESVKLQLWGIAPGETEQTMEEIDILCSSQWDRFFFDINHPLSDWLPKVQFHEADKSVDGSNVLLIFNGMQDAPVWNNGVGLQYRLTEDTYDMTLLNDGVPCWNFSNKGSRVVSQLPSFRRNKTAYYDGDVTIVSSFEWGKPLARGVNELYYDADIPVTIYDRYWKRYQADRYDVDTFKMTCKVDLRGLLVGQELMQKFFYYQGAYFVLNKIVNHSLTTWDDTECEFIKVQDMINYLS